MIYDVAIIGAGPAGMTAAIYATRAALSTVVLERAYAGGQMTLTSEIDNFPGFKNISGFELSAKMSEHAKELGAEIKTSEVRALNFGEKFHTIDTDSGEISARTVILALGASRRKLGVDGEDRLSGSGVSYCATCDGGFFRGKDACVVGGGNTALEDALYLAKLCKKVYVIHRRNEFRGFDALSELVKKTENIELVLDSTVESINGNFKVESVTVRDKNTNTTRDIPLDACFIAVGSIPNTELVAGKIKLTDSGYILAGEDTVTSVPGVFAAGDLREKISYQIVTACADGAVAAHMAGAHLAEKDR